MDCYARRFEPLQWKRYTDLQTEQNDPYSLFCNTVLRMAGDQNGKIYLLCTEGVAQFDLTTQRFTTLLQGNINSIYYKNGLFIGKRMKYTAIMSKPITLIFTTRWQEKTSKYPACSKTKDTCG